MMPMLLPWLSWLFWTTPLVAEDHAVTNTQAKVAVAAPVYRLGGMTVRRPEPQTPPARQPGQAQVAVVIDDLGHNFSRDRLALDLPAAVALAVLPSSPAGPKIAQLGARQGRAILIHLPMEGEDMGNAEPGTLTVNMSPEQWRRHLAEALQAVPEASGINNHQGSVLTAEPLAMQWLMQAIKQQGNLFFLDSRTTAQSVAYRTARRTGLPVLSRRVFLDHQTDEAAMQSAFEDWIRLARRDGQAIAIAHPHSLEWLAERLERLSAEGVTLVPLTALLPAATVVRTSGSDEHTASSTSVPSPR